MYIYIYILATMTMIIMIIVIMIMIIMIIIMILLIIMITIMIIIICVCSYYMYIYIYIYILCTYTSYHIFLLATGSATSAPTPRRTAAGRTGHCRAPTGRSGVHPALGGHVSGRSGPPSLRGIVTPKMVEFYCVLSCI